MSEVVYSVDIRIDRIKGTFRHAWLPAHEGPVEFGVHGAIKEHYGVEPERDITTTLDYVIAATGGHHIIVTAAAGRCIVIATTSRCD